MGGGETDWQPLKSSNRVSKMVSSLNILGLVFSNNEVDTMLFKLVAD